ncbi:MAG: hypothetical protein AAGJ35_12175 [Myxococcota bacterium]
MEKEHRRLVLEYVWIFKQHTIIVENAGDNADFRSSVYRVSVVVERVGIDAMALVWIYVVVHCIVELVINFVYEDSVVLQGTV